MRADLIVANAAQLVTCASVGPKRGSALRDLGLIPDGAVAVKDGIIIDVGETERITVEHEATETIDATGRIVSPGFVDPHTHIVFAGNRFDEFELKIKGAEYLEILRKGGGILSTVRATRAASVGELVESALTRLDKMLACGTTTCEIKTGYGLDSETELKMLDAIAELDRRHAIDIVPTFLAAHAIPPEFESDADGYVRLICDEMLPSAWNWHERSRFNGLRPFFVDVFCEKNAFDLKQTRKVLQTAKDLGFVLKAHVDEFTNLGGSRLAIAMGATSIDHLDAISEEEVRLLAASDTIGIVTPTVNFNFGSREFADARRLIDAGCAVALSTDYNPGSAPCPSQPMVMAIACRYQKLLPAEALNACTINAAWATGRSKDVGSIEIGKQADLVIADSKDYRELMYEFGRLPAMTVVKRGQKAEETNG